jgi:hypothetical protein
VPRDGARNTRKGNTENATRISNRKGESRMISAQEKIFKDSYSEIMDRYQKVKDDTSPDNEGYCIGELLEGGLQDYQMYADWCRELTIYLVVDIGCCYGHQCSIFEKYGINYIGVETCNFNFFHQEKHTYINHKYPVNFKGMPTNSAAISHLCVGWLITDDKDIKQIAKDFPIFIGQINKKTLPTFEKYFTVRRCIKEDIDAHVVLKSKIYKVHA